MRGLKMLQNQPHTVLVYLSELLDLAKNEELGRNRNSPPHLFFKERMHYAPVVLAAGLDNLDLYLFLIRLEIWKVCRVENILNTVGIMESMHHSLIKQALSYIEKDCVSQQELHFSFSWLILWTRTWELFLQGARSSRTGTNICIFAIFSEQS